MKKRFVILKFVLIVIIVLSIIGEVYYTVYASPTAFRFKQDSYSSKVVPQEFNNFKIGFLSDINLKEAKDMSQLEDRITQLNSYNCDMVLFGGDLYENAIYDQEKVIAALGKIKTSYGKFAVFGDKDHIDTTTIQNILNGSGFEILHNEARNIYYKGKVIYLFGLENNGDCSTMINDSNKDGYKIALCHQPDYFDNVKDSQVNLQLSGHTLGGVVNLPIYGGVFKDDKGKKYTFGKHSNGNSHLFISNGYALDSAHSMRFFTENEINIITLKADS